MPKRMLDDSFLSSPSLARCSARAQDAFPRFILLADDFGCFEAFPRVLMAKGWPYRTDVIEADVWAWLEEYVSVGMACLWTEKDRRWCYLTGWDGPHGQRKRVEYKPEGTQDERKGSKRRTPPPPTELVEAVKAGNRREITGKSEFPAQFPPISRQKPAPAVAVAVAVPVVIDTLSKIEKIPSSETDLPVRTLQVLDRVEGTEETIPLSLEADLPAAPDPAHSVVDTWNRICVLVGLPKARLTSSRRDTIRTRVRDDKAWMEDFEKACLFVSRDSFYRGMKPGSDGRKYTANIDLLLQRGKATSLAEKLPPPEPIPQYPSIPVVRG